MERHVSLTVKNGQLHFDAPVGLMLHHFHGEGHPLAQGSISANQFDSLLDAIGPERILTADEWLDRSISGTLPADAVCLTFDDNLRCQYDIALPVLMRRGMTGFWNINTAPLSGVADRLEIYRYFRVNCFKSVNVFYDSFFAAIEKTLFADKVKKSLVGFVPADYLSEHKIYTDQDRAFRYVRDEVLGWVNYVGIMDAMLISAGLDDSSLGDRLWMRADHIKDLVDKGQVIGLHTHNHPTRLDLIAPDAQCKEYMDNHKALLGVLGGGIVSMSHPNGRYTPLVLDCLRDLGIQIGFRAVPVYGPTLLEQPRYDHSELMAALKES